MITSENTPDNTAITGTAITGTAITGTAITGTAITGNGITKPGTPDQAFDGGITGAGISIF